MRAAMVIRVSLSLVAWLQTSACVKKLTTVGARVEQVTEADVAGCRFIRVFEGESGGNTASDQYSARNDALNKAGQAGATHAVLVAVSSGAFSSTQAQIKAYDCSARIAGRPAVPKLTGLPPNPAVRPSPSDWWCYIVHHQNGIFSSICSPNAVLCEQSKRSLVQELSPRPDVGDCRQVAEVVAFTIQIGNGPEGYMAYLSEDHCEASRDISKSDPAHQKVSDCGEWRSEVIAATDQSRPKEQFKAIGTCFAVTADGLVATNAHVVQGATRVSVHFPSTGETGSARVVAKSESTDLAVLDVDAKPASYLPLSTDGPSLGDKVFTIGFPEVLVLGVEPKLTEGVISSLSSQGEASLLQITVPVHKGNSGGPLVTEDGSVVGVVTARISESYFYDKTKTLPQNINFAVNGRYLRPLLPTGVDTLDPVDREGAIERASGAACLVLVE